MRWERTRHEDRNSRVMGIRQEEAWLAWELRKVSQGMGDSALLTVSCVAGKRQAVGRASWLSRLARVVFDASCIGEFALKGLGSLWSTFIRLLRSKFFGYIILT